MRHSGPTNPATHGHLRAQPAVFRAQFPPGPPAAAITAELARWHRFAVPFNLIYAPGKPDPVVLPELLTPGIVLEKLAQAEAK